MNKVKTPCFILLLVFLSVVFFAACSQLRESKPIYKIKDYEKLLLGDIMANYVGIDNCLAACHSHDKIREYFEASTMGVLLKSEPGMPLVDCESCHGPGSSAIEGLTAEKVAADRAKGIETPCNYKKLINFNMLPSGARSLICLKCHTANANFNIHNWNAGAHAQNDVSCSDCHPIHAGVDITTKPREIKKRCFKCHQDVRAEFSLPSRHPVNEDEIFCNDCHDGHGTSTPKLLKKHTVKETCTQCHTEKGGPFLYEHADNTEDCTACHNRHGSVYDNLLKFREPFLCLQCHIGHQVNTTTGTASTLENKGAFYSRCTDCHSQIHGTDTPSPSGPGRFIQ